MVPNARSLPGTETCSVCPIGDSVYMAGCAPLLTTATTRNRRKTQDLSLETVSYCTDLALCASQFVLSTKHALPYLQPDKAVEPSLAMVYTSRLHRVRIGHLRAC